MSDEPPPWILEAAAVSTPPAFAELLAWLWLYADPGASVVVTSPAGLEARARGLPPSSHPEAVRRAVRRRQLERLSGSPGVAARAAFGAHRGAQEAVGPV